MPNAHAVTADHTPIPSPLADAPPASADSSAFGPVRPDRMTVWPTDDGRFGIDVRWAGRECILRSVVVRRLLTDAGYATATGNSADGRIWELKVTGIPSDEVASLIRDQIW